MSYAAVTDVQAYVSTFTISSTSVPNTTQVNELITNCAAEIDSVLKSRGLNVPVTVPDEFVTWLRLLNAQGAAGLALFQAFPTTMAPGETPLGKYLCDTYQARLADLRKGIGVPVGLAVFESDLAPRGFLTDSGAWSQGEDAEDVFGNVIAAQPAFRREQVF